jgi:hypothetical protein
VITGDADAVKPGHLSGGIGEDVGYYSHGHGRRIDIGIPDHKLFQDIILNGPAQ